MYSVFLDRLYRNLNKRFPVKRAAAVFVLFLLFAMAVLNLYRLDCPRPVPPKPCASSTQLQYMLHGDHVDSGYLLHVQNVLQRLGFQRVNNSADFDLLWSHVYPFGERAPFPKPFLQNLRPYQKINHIPGSGFFTNKVDLAVSNLKHIPRAFHLPAQKDQVLKHALKNPDLMFVQKSNSHRGIKILKIDDMNLDLSGTFVQEYVPNPLLVDGHKFDIGIYTVLTSVDPLRVYIYDADALLRFCPKKYYPFDAEDVDKYVVGDDYIPTWQMPSLKKAYTELKYGMKESLNAHLRFKGKDPQKIWDQIEESIATVFLAKEDLILGITKNYKNQRNFFEMVRFDFVVDSELNVFLMEANMSPNLSSEHFPPNKLLYESVLFSLFSLVGVGRRIHSDSLRYRSFEEEQMEVSEKSLMVFAEQCVDTRCQGCGAPHCMLCRNCLTDKALSILKESYLEHVNRMNCKRIFPPTFKHDIKLKDIDLDLYSPENRLIVQWFIGKCQLDKSWC